MDAEETDFYDSKQRRRYGGVSVYYQPTDEANVQAVDFFTGNRFPFDVEEYSKVDH